MKCVRRFGWMAAMLLLVTLLLSACSGSVFERAMSQIEKPRGCKEWTYLINDYDGDGKAEAFVFGGRPDPETTMWRYLEVYYVDPRGNVTQMLSRADAIVGAPYETVSVEQTDFSDCYLTIKKEQFALFYAGSVYGSCGYTLALGVHKGVPSCSQLEGTVERVTDQGLVIMASIDDDCVYAYQDGQFNRAKRFDY